MSISQKYAVSQPPIQTLFTWIDSGQIAIPEIQRPFVWDATQVRNLLDSLYQGFPVGYLIGWQNPDVKLKDGTSSQGKRILIDGQQRVTALMASLLGREVVNKQYKQVRIRIAFHPETERFEVFNSAIAKDPMWIPDVAVMFRPNTSMFKLVNDYCERNPGTSQDEISHRIESLRSITNNQIGLIELDHDLDIETVTEIFIRVNSAGAQLGQADFAMSKIAVNETYGGNTLRKAIDYFCHLAKSPDFHNSMRNDQSFLGSEYYQKVQWLKNESDALYDPTYTDVLRVAFTSEFGRGRLADLVALLSGRDFETKTFEESVVEQSFARMRQGVINFINETNFKQFLLILKSAGFVDPVMVRAQNAMNFAYILYLSLYRMALPAADRERLVRKWFVMSLLTGRHSGSFETRFEQDIRAMREQGAARYIDSVFRGELSEAFWTVTLPQQLNTSATSSQMFRLFQAAQVKANDRGFLSRDITVKDLIEVKSDVHHLFPRDYLKKQGIPSSQYNQIANFVVAQSEINIAIGNKEPALYFTQLDEQVNGGPKRYGNITDLRDLDENFRQNCIPEGVHEMTHVDFGSFLQARRQLMAQKIRTYFESL